MTPSPPLMRILWYEAHTATSVVCSAAASGRPVGEAHGCTGGGGGVAGWALGTQSRHRRWAGLTFVRLAGQWVVQGEGGGGWAAGGGGFWWLCHGGGGGHKARPRFTCPQLGFSPRPAPSLCGG